MKHAILLSILAISVFSAKLGAQGCVAIRSESCSGNLITGSSESSILFGGDFIASVGYRYFKSFRHFRGSTEEANRVEDGTQVINHFNGIDLGLTYGINDRLSATVIVPLLFIDRSSLYEHYGNSLSSNPEQKRFHTQSAGLGDLRLAASYWLFEHGGKGNIALGGTVKFPTGKPDVMDEFHKLDSLGQDYTITQAVDQSIQLGDGAFGFGLEVQGYQTLGNRFSLYYNGSYLVTPKNVNTTLRRASADPENVYSYFSCPDQYAARLGVFASITHSLVGGIGGRIEGIPSSDLFGKSEGFRRPGYVISVEPGISYLHKQFAFSLNVPLALVRDRTQSTQDKLRSTPDHFVNGDAAFADYTINATVTYTFSHAPIIEMQHQQD